MNNSPVSGYNDKSYWDKRYEAFDGGLHDWYLSYEELKEKVPELEGATLQPEGAETEVSEMEALVVGCGNSSLSASLATEGFKTVVSVDYSKPCIDMMRASYKDEPALVWKVMDVRKLSFQAERFHVIYDKGTLDTVLTAKDSSSANKMLAECHRVLAPGGCFYLVSFARPKQRVKMLQRPRYRWTVKHIPLEQSRHLYVMRKRA